jgi:hypothetical protein
MESLPCLSTERVPLGRGPFPDRSDLVHDPMDRGEDAVGRGIESPAGDHERADLDVNDLAKAVCPFDATNRFFLLRVFPLSGLCGALNFRLRTMHGFPSRNGGPQSAPARDEVWLQARFRQLVEKGRLPSVCLWLYPQCLLVRKARVATIRPSRA